MRIVSVQFVPIFMYLNLHNTHSNTYIYKLPQVPIHFPIPILGYIVLLIPLLLCIYTYILRLWRKKTVVSVWRKHKSHNNIVFLFIFWRGFFVFFFFHLFEGKKTRCCGYLYVNVYTNCSTRGCPSVKHKNLNIRITNKHRTALYYIQRRSNNIYRVLQDKRLLFEITLYAWSNFSKIRFVIQKKRRNICGFFICNEISVKNEFRSRNET